jgi:tRNA U38,U39,U40 pseudouridine synthase TruA
MRCPRQRRWCFTTDYGGDRLVGYTLLANTKAVDQEAVKAFLKTLRAAGIQPDEVITDDSRLYRSARADMWPTAVHQLCLFHATRRLVRAVNDVVKQIRRSIPLPPPASLPSLLGRSRPRAGGRPGRGVPLVGDTAE